MSNITNFNFNGADVRQSSQSSQSTYRDIGFVYVVEDAAAGRVKIGMSSKPEQRIRSVRSSAGIAGGRSYTSVRAKDAAVLDKSPWTPDMIAWSPLPRLPESVKRRQREIAERLLIKDLLPHSLSV